MAANTMTFQDISTVLNNIVKLATGKTFSDPIDTGSFMTVAKAALETGYDPFLGALSQVLSKTVFSARAYTPKFKGLMRDAQAYGNHVRKVNILMQDAVTDTHYTASTGSESDQFAIKKPDVFQTNFYGGNTWMDHLTIFKDQINSALSGPDEFARFLSAVMTMMNNKRALQDESMARMALCNFAAGKIAQSADTYHLLTMYASETGFDTTSDNIYDPSNYVPFVKWCYGKIAGICAMMTEQSVKFHTNLTISGTAKEFTRHTPYAEQHVYMLAGDRYAIESQVLADTYHDNYLKKADVETVNFWHKIDEPGTINVKPSYLHTDGTIKQPNSAIDQDNVFAVVVDTEAVGVTTILDAVDMSPYQARDRYWNQFWHSSYRFWNDFSENGVVFLLD